MGISAIRVISALLQVCSAALRCWMRWSLIRYVSRRKYLMGTGTTRDVVMSRFVGKTVEKSVHVVVFWCNFYFCS